MTKLTMQDYLARNEISRSDLNLIHRSPYHYRWFRENPKSPTDSQIFMSAIHECLFEPEKFAESVVIQPEEIKVRRGEKWDAFLKEHTGKTILKQDEFDTILSIQEAVFEHPAARKLIDLTGRAEHTILWNHASFPDIGLRCRPDLIHPKGIIVDAKCVDDASPSGFRYLLTKHRWYCQAAFYLDALEAIGEKPAGFVFVTYEEKPPHAVACYQASEDMIRVGRMEYLEDLATYRKCLDSGMWPAYSDKIEIMDLPEWKKNQTQL